MDAAGREEKRGKHGEAERDTKGTDGGRYQLRGRKQ